MWPHCDRSQNGGFWLGTARPGWPGEMPPGRFDRQNGRAVAGSARRSKLTRGDLVRAVEAVVSAFYSRLPLADMLRRVLATGVSL